MKSLLLKLAAFASVMILLAGCSQQDTTPSKGDENDTTVASSADSIHEKTIRTFLKLEFTGPNKELKKALSSTNPTLLGAYNKKYYQPLFAKDYFQDFINGRYDSFWLRAAYKEGYQLKPVSIKIKKTESGDYSWKAKVEYTKEGKTKTSTCNGKINLNDNGKIIWIKFISDDGLWKDLNPDSKGEAS